MLTAESAQLFAAAADGGGGAALQSDTELLLNVPTVKRFSFLFVNPLKASGGAAKSAARSVFSSLKSWRCDVVMQTHVAKQILHTKSPVDMKIYVNMTFSKQAEDLQHTAVCF